MLVSSGGMGLKTKRSVWAEPSFVFIPEVIWELRPQATLILPQGCYQTQTR